MPLSLLAFLVCILQLRAAQIKLLYPPERYSQADFPLLPYVASPCELPRSKTGYRTEILASKPLEVIWSGSADTKGVMEFEIVDSMKHMILRPTVANTTVSLKENLWIKHATLLLKDGYQCKGCELRVRLLQHEPIDALLSCADVDIVEDNAHPCSNHGASSDGICTCDRLYSGDYCQFDDECWQDTDCGRNGKCIPVQKKDILRRLCFCHSGWFGRKCSKRSNSNIAVPTDMQHYHERSLANDGKLHWRILEEENELEIVLRYPGRRWMAVGWFTDDELRKCSTNLDSYSVYTAAPYVIETTDSAPSEDDQSEIEHVDTVEATGRPIGFVDTLVTSAPDTPSTVTNLAISVELPVVNEEPAGVLAETCFGEMRWPADCKECRYHLSWSYSEDTQLIDFSLETQLPANAWSGVGFSQSSTGDNADVLIVKSQGDHISIDDMHTNEYGNFVLDDKQSYVNNTVVGTHTDGILRAAFSRPRSTLDRQDAQITDQNCYYMIFYVEGGQIGPNGEILQPLKARISQDKVCIKPCTSVKRQNYCPRNFEYPNGCTGNDCEYQARWDYNDGGDKVTFTVSSRTDGKRWTGIGFSRTGSMLNSDIVMGWVHNGQTMITDRFAYGKHQPAIDKFQDIFDVFGRAEDGVQTIQFSRNITTSDHREDLPLTECLYFLFPVGGGPVMAKSDEEFLSSKAVVGFHDIQLPIVSPQPVCLLCDQSNEESESHSQRRNAEVNFRRKRQSNSNAGDFACNDLVLATAFGNLSRITAPYNDSEILWADGHEVDGHTMIAFRHKLDTSSRHLLPTDKVTFLWAREGYTVKEAGQSDSLPQEADVRNPMITLKTSDGSAHYESSKFTLNFFERSPDDENPACTGTFKYPNNCDGDNCQYIASWSRYGSNVKFSLSFIGTPNEWSGIGFSKNGFAAGSDIIVVLILPEGKVEVTDRSTSNHRTTTIDEQQNIFDIRSEYESGRAKVTFSRSLTTNDESNDVDLSDCVYFLYLVRSGKIESSGQIAIHPSNVKLSKSLICLGQCRTVDITAKTDKPIPKPPKSDSKRYRLRFDVRNLNITDELSKLSDDGSPALLHTLEIAIKAVLQRKFKESEIHVSSLRGDHQVDMEIMAKNTNVKRLYDSIIPAARQHQFGSYEIDPTSISIVELDQRPTAEEVRNYVIIAVISAFVLLAIILTICIVWQIRKRRSKYPPRHVTDKKRYVSQNYPAHYPKVFPIPMYQHARHYSSPSALAPKETASNGRTTNGQQHERIPPRSVLNPMFTTSYGEWRERIAPESSQQAPAYIGHPGQDATFYQQDSWQKPYVTYPTDSLSYYSMNGTQKLGEQSSSKGK
uniref:DOMON domain-containing protein n=1 Tax=Trichuris muris TaxID=70415 RepID=A0A5S6Q6R2_TRIMR